MKIRPYDRSSLWRAAFAERSEDPDRRDREALAEAYRQLRDRAGVLVGEIHAALPNLTVHDLTHADSLWDVTSEICGPDFKINPLEAFVLGASFLLHDAGMAFAAYRKGIMDIENSLEWRDAVVAAWKSRGVEDPTGHQREQPPSDVSDEAIFQVLRERHASQAKELAVALWTLPSGRALALVQNDDLLESYGLLIGDISASHHWPLPEVARYFGDSTPASAAWPRDWDVDGLTLASILRCADACAIDETRAPSFLYAIRKPVGVSKRHWNFQNKIYPAKRREDGLIFESKSSFQANEADDWWLCFDAIEVADRELRGVDALLADRRRRALAARRVIGAGDPDILSSSVKVSGWRPVNTLPKISDPSSIIERLGGKQLYGDEPIVPLRELIQNSVDAIRARRFVDPHFSPTSTERYPGQVLIEFERIPQSPEYWMIVEDNGIGMSERTITRSLLDFGTSFWASPAAARLYPGLPSERDFKPIGKFGIGFFSVFMYSDVVVVMSKEFRSGLDDWVLVSFQHGVRGRGDLSVVKMPKEISLPNANTRVKVRVGEDFLRSLSRRVWDVPRNDSLDDAQHSRLTARLSQLVCALDVRVTLRIDGNSISLNEPLIYEKDLETIWRLVNVDGKKDNSRQKNMLSLLATADRPYGYCGLNLGRYDHGAFKSVGGIVAINKYNERDPIVGVAEYGVSAANRSPENLAAPDEAISAWVKEQVKRVRKGKLSASEREHATWCLGRLVGDARPIFCVRTSEGALNLEQLVAAIGRTGSLTIPIYSYPTSASQRHFGGLSIQVFSSADAHEYQTELYLNPDEINFCGLTVVSTLLVPAFVADVDEEFDLMLKDDDLDQYRDLLSVVVKTLTERGTGFKVKYVPGANLGRYTGPDSPRHSLKGGDDIMFETLQIILVDGI